MRILELTAHFSPNLGGVETHLDNLVDVLASKHKVFVLTYMPLISEKSAKVHESKHNLHILRIPWFPGLFYKFQGNPALELLYLAPPLFLLTPFVALLGNFEVIHAHGLISSFVAVFWGKVLGLPVVTTTHSIYNFPATGLYRSFVKLIFRNSSSVLTLSNQSKIEIESLGVSPEKVKAFRYWIDLKNFDEISGAKKELGWDGFNVLFVGRLVSEKGVKVLLDSAKVWDKNITLKIAGEGPLKDMVKTYAAKYSNIEFLGRVDQMDLPVFYSASDLTIVPSQSEEGFGRVVIESLACGTPVVGANRGGIPEAMNESVGVLIDVSTENIKKAVTKLKNNRELLSRLSKSARQFAVKNYSSKNAQVIIDAICA